MKQSLRKKEKEIVGNDLEDNLQSLTRKTFQNSNNLHPRVHSKLVDKVLGFKTPKIENKLLRKFSAYDQYVLGTKRKRHFEGTQAWIGLHPQVLQTPYVAILEALDFLKSQDIRTIIDIGAGYGRVGIVSSVLFPDANFIGYEIVKERQIEGERVFRKYGIKSGTLVLQNVLDPDFNIPSADVYFIYDFSEKEDITEVLLKIGKSNKSKKILIAQGDRVSALMSRTFRHSWQKLESMKTSKLTIYQSNLFQ
jgi:precorrin-6B methylase 2